MKKIRNKFTKEERKMRFFYKDFIISEWWTKQKLDWYSRHKKICAKCKNDKYINLHHKHYPRNGKYLSMVDNTFVALCKSCHFKYHKLFGVEKYMQKKTNKWLKGERSI